MAYRNSMPEMAAISLPALLWTALIAGVQLLFPQGDLLLLTKLLGGLLLGLAALFAYLSFRPFIGWWAAWLPLAFYLHPIITSTIGNEVALIYVAMFGFFWALFSLRFVWMGIFLGLGYLCRGEFIFMGAPMLIHLALLGKHGHLSQKDLIKGLLQVGGISLAIALIWHIYYAWNFGQLFPDTLQAKIVQGKSRYWKLFIFRLPESMFRFGQESILFFGLVIAGALWRRYLSGLILVYLFLHGLVYGLLQVAYYHWYAYDFFILSLILALFGLMAVFQISGKFLAQKLPRLITPGIQSLGLGLALLVILTGSFHFFKMKKRFPRKNGVGKNVEQSEPGPRYKAYQEVSRRIQQIAQAGDILLSPEIGIVGHELPQMEIRDINGLASPGVTIENINDWTFFCRKISASISHEFQGMIAPKSGASEKRQMNGFMIRFSLSPTKQGIKVCPYSN